jgi:hypothetical protein
VSLLQSLKLIRSDQQRLIDMFVDKVKQALNEYGVGQDHFGADEFRRMLEEFKQTMAQQNQLNGRLTGQVIEGVEVGANERVENREHRYNLHYYNGLYHLVPEDWRIPRCGVKDLWIQWWIGDMVRNIPPLRRIKNIDVRHINSLPLGKDETHRRTGKYKGQRRSCSKLLCDMKFLMNSLTKIVDDHGKLEKVITIGSVEKMYELVSKRLIHKDRDLQKMWLTVAKDFRLKKIRVRQ